MLSFDISRVVKSHLILKSVDSENTLYFLEHIFDTLNLSIVFCQDVYVPPRLTHFFVNRNSGAYKSSKSPRDCI